MKPAIVLVLVSILIGGCANELPAILPTATDAPPIADDIPLYLYKTCRFYMSPERHADIYGIFASVEATCSYGDNPLNADAASAAIF